MKRLNWKYAVWVTLIGGAVIFGGLALGDFTKDAFSAVLVEVGAAIGLVAVLIALENRLEARVTQRAEETATEAASRATSDLRERVIRLENLDAEQSRVRADRRRKADAQVAEILNGELTVEGVGEILSGALDEQLFDDALFRVRTSPDPEAHVLYMLLPRDAEGVEMMWLDFEQIEISDNLIDVGGNVIRGPNRSPSTVQWTSDDDAAAVAANLEDGLQRQNKPLHGFKLSYALAQLVKSATLMRNARSAPANDPARLHGRLRLLINDEWAITSFGLESTESTTAFKSRWADWRGRQGAARWHGSELVLDSEVVPDGNGSWEEALRWVQEREGWTIQERPH